MVALAYESLGGISGVVTNPKVPASKRSRDQNDFQRIAFQCDLLRPFTGTIHIQASVGDPTKTDQTALWFDIAEMVINNEGGTWAYEARGEFSSIRVICREGNYWTAVHGIAGATLPNSDNALTFTINGIMIEVNSQASAEDVATAINENEDIIADGTIFADTVVPTALRIYKIDGDTLILVDGIGDPLDAMGIATGSYEAGIISSIVMLR
jgi:hypothetical protein